MRILKMVMKMISYAPLWETMKAKNITTYTLITKHNISNHQMVNTKIRLIIFFAAKGGEVLYSQQEEDRELTVAQIMNSLLPNSDLN